MRPKKKPNMEPIAGYRLVELLGTGGFGEVWKCEAPGGLFKAIKIVHSAGSLLDEAGPSPRSEEWRAIAHIKDIRHPFLISMERVEVVGEELIIVMELADRNLAELLRDCQKRGEPGVPRQELLGYLREAAEVLDLMSLEYGLQHLDIKPRNLLQVRGHVKIGDFGLVQTVGREGAGKGPAAVTPLYAAPELFQGAISRSCDQYSLAIVYQELLTGRLPFSGKNARQLLYQHTLEAPDLSPLPEEDRVAVNRALAKTPTERYPTCMAFVQALYAANLVNLPESGSSAVPSAETRTNLSVANTVPLGPVQGRVLPDHQFLTCLGRDPLIEVWETRGPDGERYRVQFIHGGQARDRARDQELALRLQALTHPALPGRTVLPGLSPGCLVTVSAVPENTLQQRFQECLARGEPGIPRDELLYYLRQAATALDALHAATGLCHLELTPARILLARCQVRTSKLGGEPACRDVLLDDFGLGELLWTSADRVPGHGASRYRAPELAAGQGSPRCDQYSLAVIYQEARTGTHPFRGQRSPGLVTRTTIGRSTSVALGEPELSSLPLAEQQVVARALDSDPGRRYESCSAFVAALEAAIRDPGGHRLELLPNLPADPRQMRLMLLKRLLEEARSAGHRPTQEGGLAFLGGSGERLEARFTASLPQEEAIRKFDGFCKQFNARVVSHDRTSARFEVIRPVRSWLPWSRNVSLYIDVYWTRARPLGVSTESLAVPFQLPEVAVTVRPGRGPASSTLVLLHQLGPLLLEAVKTSILGGAEKRCDERVLWPYPVQVAFRLSEENLSAPIECPGKDLSLAGAGFYLPTSMPTARVHLGLVGPRLVEPLSLQGVVIRVQRWAEQFYEVGVAFD